MSSDDPHRKGQDFLQIVAKAKEFTEELLKENERLRFKIASLETSGATAGSEERSKEFADRYVEIEEQNNNLANLYVASYQLHSTLDYKEVVRIVQEIVINLIGAEVFHLLMFSEKTHALEVETSEGQVPGRTTIPLGEGPIGSSAQT